MASNFFGKKATPELVNLSGETETEAEEFIQWLRNHLYFDILESTEKMSRGMEAYLKRERNCEENLENLKRNLNDLRQVIFDSSSSASMEKATFSSDMRALLMARGSMPSDRRKEQLDIETSRELIRFLMNEIEEGAYKLEENMTMAKEAQDTNIRHLKNIEKSIQETETELVKEESRRSMETNERSKYTDPKRRHNFVDVGMNTERITESTNHSNRRLPFSLDGNLTPTKRMRVDDGIFTSPSLRDRSEGCGSRDSSEKTPAKDKKITPDKEEIRNTATTQDDARESQGAVEECLGDAESHVTELRRRVNAFEELVTGSRRVLNELTGSLDSIWMANREEKRNRELERLAEAEIIRNLESQSSWNQIPSSQQGPSSGVNDHCRRNVFSTECSLFGTPSYDTYSDIAQNAIRRSIGPLTPENLTSFLNEVKKKQNYFQFIYRFTTDIEAFVQQLKLVKTYLDDAYKDFINTPGNRAIDFDRRLILRLECLITKLERNT